MPDLQKILENWPAKVLALAAALLLFLFNRFDSLQTRVFTIPLRLVTDTSLLPAQDYSHRVRVTIRGSDDLVSQVSESDLEALVDYSGHQGEGAYSAPIQVKRRGAAAENTALEVAVEPLVMDVHLERKLVKTVTVHPAFVGQPAKDFVLSGFQVLPAVITIEGPRSTVDNLTSVETEPIELRGKTDSFTLRARVEAGTGLVSFPYGSSVEVQGIMTSSLASLVLDGLPPTAINVAPGLRVSGTLPVVKLRVRGAAAALQSLHQDAQGNPTVRVVADLTGFTMAGEVPSLELRAELPEGVQLVDMTPASVSVYLEVKP